MWQWWCVALWSAVCVQALLRSTVLKGALMIPDEREHLERLADVCIENIHHLEMQVAMAKGVYAVEWYLWIILDQQRTELADVHRQLAQYTEPTQSHSTKTLMPYLQERSLGGTETDANGEVFYLARSSR